MTSSGIRTITSWWCSENIVHFKRCISLVIIFEWVFFFQSAHCLALLQTELGMEEPEKTQHGKWTDNCSVQLNFYKGRQEVWRKPYLLDLKLWQQLCLRQGLALQLVLAWDSLHAPSWSWTHGNFPVSVSSGWTLMHNRPLCLDAPWFLSHLPFLYLLLFCPHWRYISGGCPPDLHTQGGCPPDLHTQVVSWFRSLCACITHNG